MKQGLAIILATLFYFTVISCSRKNAQVEILPFDTMKVVLWDLLNADEWNSVLIEKDSTLRRTKNNLKLDLHVFKMHQISKELFFSSYKFYEEHPDKMKMLMDTLSFYGQKQKEKLQKNRIQ